MSLTLVTPPASFPVTLAEAKAHLRVDHDDDDAQVTQLIAAATATLDGLDGLLGRCLISQVWRLTLNGFMPVIALPLPPARSVESIAYTDASGDVLTLAPSAYTVAGLGSSDHASIHPAHGTSWPTTRHSAEAVSITFTAGYGDEPEAVPEPLRAAILQHVGTLYDNRESVAESGYVKPLPHGYDDLIRGYRMWAF